MERFSYLRSPSAAFIDEQFELYKSSPESMEPSWRSFFDGIEFAQHELSGTASQATSFSTEAAVAELIHAYRNSGKLIANINPIAATPDTHPLLELANFGLDESHLDRSFRAARLLGREPCTLREILAILRRTYCTSLAVEFMHIQDSLIREWLQQRMELSLNQEVLSSEKRKNLLKRLVQAQSWETFLNTRYVAQKRFSLEGGESLIPLLDRLIDVGSELGAEEIVMGMAHRGRLNVLYNSFGKKAEHILTEFEEAYFAGPEGEKFAIGDVKYHMGYSSDIQSSVGKPFHLSLAHNPSHLEFVNPVVEGMVRAKQRSKKDESRGRVIPVLIHGDAAFAGQGVIYETLNLSQVSGFRTGGTVHVVINNQVGFTTDPADARSTPYCTDVAMMVECPIFHVNGDDPEACVYAARLAMEFRQTFKRDVFIDLVCYRKYGHNEGDEPAFTQPLMYKTVRAHDPIASIYAKRLDADGLGGGALAKEFQDAEYSKLSLAQEKIRAEKTRPFDGSFGGLWKNLKLASTVDPAEVAGTNVQQEALIKLSKQLNTIPASFHLHPKLNKFFDARLEAVEKNSGIDWGNAEALAYGSLLSEGHHVRLTGQDVERGTFTHRHAVLKDIETGLSYTPHSNLSDSQGSFIIRNSILSETAVLGFEYGWSLTDPNALVIWEAQFGDFANGAQVIIDQFISSGEIKWRRSSGLVLFLPHGFEGQGPEHSSARLERFLQLCGDNNISVCNFTTPAQLFHALRRQVKRSFRHPMVVMTPKSLLRHPMAVSRADDLTGGRFFPVLADPVTTPSKVDRVILCSGKVYYELLTEKNSRPDADRFSIVRIEELHPWPTADLKSILIQFPQAEIVWAQEEPRNQGAWTYVHGMWSGGLDLFQDQVGGRKIRYVGRKISAVPSIGSHKAHVKTQSELVKAAFL